MKSIRLFRRCAGDSMQRWHHAEQRLGADSDAVHDLRVAIRRLRAQLSAFEGVVDGKWARQQRKRLGFVGQQIGVARDSEVVLLTVDRALGEMNCDHPWLLSLLRERRDALRAVAERVVRSTNYIELQTVLEHEIANPPHGPNAKGAAADQIVDAAHASWNRLRKSVRHCGSTGTPEQLHAMRIAAKRLRYTSEVAGLVVEGTPDFITQLKDFQDYLGEHHDKVVAAQAALDAGAALTTDEARAGDVAAHLRRGAMAMASNWRAEWEALRVPELRRWMKRE